MMTVLFACVQNAGRSQMAAAWFNRLADPAQARAISAGTSPAPAVHPEVVAVMRECGIELGAATPGRLTESVAGQAHWFITMGCGDACPVAFGAVVRDWALADPHGRSLDEVRVIRDQIEARVRALIGEQGWGRDRLPPQLT